MKSAQDHVGPEEYDLGSPHLKHAALKADVVARLRSLVLEQLDRSGRCRVLEIGGGSGVFTDHLLAAGAEVVVTEANERAARLLKQRLRHNPRVQVVFDPDDTWLATSALTVELVVFISVLHHIPDYMTALEQSLEVIEPNGAFVSFQDPLYYPRRSRWSLRGDRAAYLTWRLRKGSFRRGAATQLRRWRGVYDPNEPGDSVEYHVVRDGVDEEALAARLCLSFGAVEVLRYWSTLSPSMQHLGQLLGATNTFAIVGRERRASN